VLAYSQGNVRRLTARLDTKQEELRRNNEYRLSLFESYRDNIISRDDFINFNANYDTKIADAETAIIAMKEEIERAAACELQNHGWTALFKSYMAADALSRKMVVELLTRVSVHDKRRIAVDFRYANEFELMREVV
jgi:hypothetical protein